MVEVLFRSFSPILGIFIKIVNFLFELADFFFMLPINWSKIKKKTNGVHFKNIIFSIKLHKVQSTMENIPYDIIQMKKVNIKVVPITFFNYFFSF